MKLSLRYNHPHQPPYHEYPDDSGQLITAPTLKALVKAVREFREINGFPVGDCEQDVAAYYATKWPWMCEASRHPEIGPPRAQESTDGVAAMEAVECFVRELWHSPQNTYARRGKRLPGLRYAGNAHTGRSLT